MMFGDSLYYFRRFIPLLYQVGTDLRVGTFNLPVNGFTDIVQQAGAF